LIGSAASSEEDTNAAVSAKYGAEVRGGFSKADIVISDEPNWFPWVTKLDVLAVLSTKSLSRSDLRLLKPEGVTVLDSSLPYVPTRSSMRVPAEETSKALFSSEKYANSIMVGYLAALLGVPKLDSLRKAVLERPRLSSPEDNLRAVEVGFELRASG
jgi:2-oxoglutarate ferredoxin oxidoreductase subunit gamma